MARDKLASGPFSAQHLMLLSEVICTVYLPSPPSVKLPKPGGYKYGVFLIFVIEYNTSANRCHIFKHSINRPQENNLAMLEYHGIYIMEDPIQYSVHRRLCSKLCWQPWHLWVVSSKSTTWSGRPKLGIQGIHCSPPRCTMTWYQIGYPNSGSCWKGAGAPMCAQVQMTIKQRLVSKFAWPSTACTKNKGKQKKKNWFFPCVHKPAHCGRCFQYKAVRVRFCISFPTLYQYLELMVSIIHHHQSAFFLGVWYCLNIHVCNRY